MNISVHLRRALFALLVLPSICFSQTDPAHVPKPPTAELQKFEPFLGKYAVSGDFANLDWTGTLELAVAIKGWYVEQTILVKSKGIDREFRMLVTWDKAAQKYRAWRFQTLPVDKENEAEFRFEGDEMITEWAFTRQDGTRGAARNRYKFASKDTIEIVSTVQIGNEPEKRIGTFVGTRQR